MFSQIPFPGRGTRGSELSIETLIEMLQENESQPTSDSSYPENFLSDAALENVAIIHRAMVTPAGIYLTGPEAESKNRVLRKYSGHHEYFLRVDFNDENGQPVFFDSRVSLQDIFHVRFKDVLRNGLTIAGRHFQFLGFSHASLRARATWFMAPFDYNGMRLNDRMVIRDLGDFSEIRSPAKCAARIGQAFSDTPNAVHVDPKTVIALNDVMFGDRVFSDGVGTISWAIAEKIWDIMNKRKGSGVMPTCFQIRYKGVHIHFLLTPTCMGPSYAATPPPLLTTPSTVLLVVILCSNCTMSITE